MKLISLFSILTLLFAITACTQDKQTENKEATDLKTILLGTWQTTQINVAVNSADGLDSFRAEYLTQAIWEKDFNMQPPIFIFQGDQKYKTIHKNLAGQVMNEARGIWNVFGDTLMLIEADVTYQYIVKSGKGKAAFRTFLDWDGDGEDDDEYQSIQRKISIGTE